MNLHTRAVSAFQLLLYTQRTDIKMRLFFNVGLSDCNAFMIICFWNVQNSLHPRFPSFFSHPLFLKYSYLPVSLALLCPLSLIPCLSLPSFFFFFKTIASLSLSLSHPSYSQPVYSLSFWRLSHSSPSFNLGYFLHRSPLYSLSLAQSLLRSMASFPYLCPFSSFLYYAQSTSASVSFSSPYYLF